MVSTRFDMQILLQVQQNLKQRHSTVRATSEAISRRQTQILPQHQLKIKSTNPPSILNLPTNRIIIAAFDYGLDKLDLSRTGKRGMVDRSQRQIIELRSCAKRWRELFVQLEPVWKFCISPSTKKGATRGIQILHCPCQAAFELLPIDYVRLCGVRRRITWLKYPKIMISLADKFCTQTHTHNCVHEHTNTFDRWVESRGLRNWNGLYK